MAVRVRRLLKRADFLKVKLGRRVSTQSFVVQYLDVPAEGGLGVGFTASTKGVGNSVQRNRARRRLKAAFDRICRLNPKAEGQGLWLVIIAKAAILEIDSNYLLKDMRKALIEAGVTLGGPHGRKKAEVPAESESEDVGSKEADHANGA